MNNYFIYKHFIDLSSLMLTGGSAISPIQKEDTEEGLLPLQEAYNTLPGSVWCKSAAGIYLGANEMTFRIVGSKIQLGRHDNELSWKDSAKDLVENDQKCMDLNASIITEESVILFNGNRYECRSLRSPVLDSKGNIVGTIGNSLYRSEIQKISKLLMPKSTLALVRGFNFFSQKKQNRYAIRSTKTNGDVLVSHREMQCAYHLFMGRTVKEISNILSLSPRTVEIYVNNLKLKLNFRKRSELIEILLENMGHFRN